MPNDEAQPFLCTAHSLTLFRAAALLAAVLRVRGGAAEGALPEHAVQQAAHQPEHHLLQQREPRGAAGQEDHRAGLLLLLHPRQDAAEPPQPGVPRLPQRPVPQPGVLRPVHPRYRHPVRQRRHQLRLPQARRDLSAPSEWLACCSALLRGICLLLRRLPDVVHWKCDG